MEAKRYHYIEHEVLRLVLQHADYAGYPVTLPDLKAFFRRSLPDVTDRELVDALKRLQPDYLTLLKWSDEHGRFIEYPAEINDDNEFFYRGSMKLRRTPRADPYLQELAVLFPSPEPEAVKKQFGFV